MDTIPKVTQVPIQQPISMNNYMHPVWVRFFETLSQVANENAIFSMQKMSGEIGGLDGEVLQISGEINDISQLIGAINQTLLGVDQNILNLQDDLDVVQTVASQSSNDIDSIELSVGINTASIANLQDAILIFQDQLQSFNGSLGILNTTLSQHAESIADLDARVAILEAP